MGATNLTESFLDAMQLVSNKTANNIPAPRTIQGVITNIVDEGSRTYAVKHGGNTFNACANSNVTYKTGDVVYILIPDGDFDKEKFIIGTAASKSSMFIAEEETDRYIPISDDLFIFNESDGIDLKSWVSEIVPLTINREHFNNLLSNYLESNRNFLFSAKVKTEIPSNHQVGGNYGLRLTLPFVEKETNNKTTRVFVMDVNNMQGNPYKYDVYQQINLYYNIDDSLIYDKNGVPTLEAFVQDFGYLDGEKGSDPEDIHIKDISFEVVNTLTQAQVSGYYLTVVADDGNYFLENPRTKILTPILKVNGKDTKVDRWECYWFLEDCSITTTSDGYSTFGGLGWKCLNEKTNLQEDGTGKTSFEYVTNQYTYEVNPEDVVSVLRYKCVLVQNETIVSGIIKLKNLGSFNEVALVTKSGSNTFIENIGTVNLIAKIFDKGTLIETEGENKGKWKPGIYTMLSWQRFDKAGNYLDNDFFTVVRDREIKEIKNNEGEVTGYIIETEIEYPCADLDQLNSIKCSFYYTETKNNNVIKHNLGTDEIIVTTSKEFNYGIVIEGGDVLYKYDADGDSPMVANYDGPLSSRITTIKSISFKIYKPDGSELTKEEYAGCHYTWSFPKNSLMTLSGVDDPSSDDNYIYVVGTGQGAINYTIAGSYNKKKNNNSILLIVQFDGNTLNASTNIKFLKDGESGTNGTKYSAIITYDNYGYGEIDNDGKIKKFQAIYYNGWKYLKKNSETQKIELVDWPDNGIPFGIKVYKDGYNITDITDTNKYDLSWKMFDSISTNPCLTFENGVLKPNKAFDDQYDGSNIIEVKVTIKGDSAGENEEIYAYYPIEISKINNQMDLIPNIAGGFDQVLYASDGTNPQYDNTNLFYCADINSEDLSKYYDYRWSSEGNLTIESKTDEQGKLPPQIIVKPISKFDNGKSKNYIKITLTGKSTQTDIDNKQVDLGKKKSKRTNWVNYRDSDYIKENAFFNYQDYINKLNNNKTTLSNRYKSFSYLDDMLDILDSVNKICNRYNKDGKEVFSINIDDDQILKINNLKKEIYQLWKIENFNDEIINPSRELKTLVIKTEKDYEIKYMGALSQLKSYTLKYYIILNSYRNSLNNLKNFNKDILSNLIKDIEDIPDILEEEIIIQVLDKQTLINIRSQLDVLISKLDEENNFTLINYDAFVKKLFDPTKDLFDIYNNKAFKEKYANDKINELNKEIKELEKEIEELTNTLNNNTLTVIKPIIMLFNRYEMSNLNGWDGNKLEIGKNDEYILAPQIGAGKKESDNSFTGMVMGIKNTRNESVANAKIGLFGFNKGTQSIFLDAKDGSATFGISGEGQIKITPGSSATIQSGDYGSGKGLKIKFNKDPEIRFGSGNFIVTSAGHLTAKDGGSIAGWNIGWVKNDRGENLRSKLSAGETTLDSNGTITCNKLIADNDGTIGGWSISDGNLKSKDGNITLNSSDNKISCGSISFGNLGGGILGIGGGGFSLSGAGLKFNADTTNVSTGSQQTTMGLSQYIDNLIVNNAYIKSKLTYQGTEASWFPTTLAHLEGTKWVTGSIDINAGTCKIEIPNVLPSQIIYLGAAVGGE